MIKQLFERLEPCAEELACTVSSGEDVVVTPCLTQHGAKHQVNYVRCADDFICSRISRELLEMEVKPLISAFMQKRVLTLSEEKTAITHIKEGFDFLGKKVIQ